MRKRLSKSPTASQDENKSEGDTRQLRSAKSFKHKHKSLSMIKDNGSKSLPSKKNKHIKTESDKKSIKDTDFKIESKLNCKKSLLNHFNDVQNQDEEDIPLGKLLGCRNNNKDDPTNSSTKDSTKKSFCETPTRRFLRPRRPSNGKSPTLNDSKDNAESLEKNKESANDLILGSNITDSTAEEYPSSDNNQNKSSETLPSSDCHIADPNSAQSCDAKLEVEHEIVSHSTSDDIKNDTLFQSLSYPSRDNLKCTKDLEINGSSVDLYSGNVASSHKQLHPFKEATLATSNDISSSVQSTPCRNMDQNFQKDDSPTRKATDAASLTPICYNSPSTGILRKRKLQDSEFSYSPSTKIRRVAFSEIVSTVEIPNRHDSLTMRDMKPNTQEQFCRNEGIIVSQGTNKENNAPIFPELTNSSCPIEVILPRISMSHWVTGLKNLLSAKNIRTVGDLAAMSEPELETLPVQQPKSSRIRDALQYWMDHINNKNKKSVKDYNEEVVSAEGKADEDNTSAKEMQSADLQKHTYEKDSSKQAITIDKASAKEGEPEAPNGETTLRMFDALEDALGRCRSNELSRIQLKAMLSKLTSIQSKVAEHIACSL